MISTVFLRTQEPRAKQNNSLQRSGLLGSCVRRSTGGVYSGSSPAGGQPFCRGRSGQRDRYAEIYRAPSLAVLYPCVTPHSTVKKMLWPVRPYSGRPGRRPCASPKDVAFPEGVRDVTILRDGVRRVIVPADQAWNDFFGAPGVELSERE